MKSKKGIQIAMNFIVVFILSIVIFSSAAVFITKFFAGTREASTQLSDQAKSQIRSILSAGKPLAIPINKITARRGDTTPVGIGVLNVRDKKVDFFVHGEFDEAFDRSEKPMSIDPADMKDWLFYDTGPYPLDPEGDTVIMVEIDVPRGIDRGTYVFNFCVKENEYLQNCGMREALYTKTIKKVYVEVV